MRVEQIQDAIARHMANFRTQRIPRGLGPLLLGNRRLRVEIRRRGDGRKLRYDADAGNFDPDVHEVVIRFDPAET